MGSARTGGRMNLLRIMTSFLCCAFFGHIHLVAIKFFIHPQPEFVLQIAFYIESILLIKVRKLLVPLMLGNVEFVAQEWPDSAQLQDALAAIHDRKLVPAHKLLSGLLVGCTKHYGILQSGYYRSADSRCCHRRGPWRLGRCEPHGRVRKRQPWRKVAGHEAAHVRRWCHSHRHPADPAALRSVRLINKR